MCNLALTGTTSLAIEMYFNERPTREEQSIATAAPAMGKGGPSPLGKLCNHPHNTRGYARHPAVPSQAAEAVENFVRRMHGAVTFEASYSNRVLSKVI